MPSRQSTSDLAARGDGRRARVLLVCALFSAFALVAPATAATLDVEAPLERALAAAREKYGLPAVAALVSENGEVRGLFATGVRAQGHMERATVSDRWHIGSDTKAFTATLIGRLVERGVLSFDETLTDALPALAGSMDQAYRSVTIAQLLSHTAGLPTLTDPNDLAFFRAIIDSAGRDVKVQRAGVARAYLAKPPASAVGTFSYSNLGYIVAGAIAEARTGKPWETLIREEVFAPLGIEHAGFGAPGSPGAIDEPRGHQEEHGALRPVEPSSPDADNPAALGPAGTINITLRDWLRFAQEQLDGEHGRGKLLSARTYRRLHTPISGNYSLGWGAALGNDGTLKVLTHTGSNGLWLADIRIMPKHGVVYLVVTNAGPGIASQAIQDVENELTKLLKPFD